MATDGKWYPPEQAPQPPQPAPVTQAVAPPPGGADGPQGPGWWQATDGRWYPPQSGQQLSSRQQARLDKSNRKALRPWYKKKRWYFLAAILLIIVLIIVIVASAANKVNKDATTVHTVVYSVTGTGTSAATDITYDTLQQGSGQQGEAQDTNVALPWSKTIHASGLFTVYSVSGTVGESGGSITCSITVDGKVVNTNTANGAFATASCNS
jgi:cytoskeletal protein RodZ